MARQFIDGFESGEHDMWDAESNATVVSSSGLDMDGDYCLDLAESTEYIEKDLTADDEMYFAFLYRPGAATAAGVLIFLDGATLVGHLKRDSGVLKAYSSLFSLLSAGSIAVNINTTYRIEVYYKIADSGGRFVVKVDGVTDIDFTGDTKPSTNTQFNKVRLGYFQNATGYSYAHFDNFIMDDLAWIGDTKIQAIVPTAGGNSTGWAASTGSNFACVDEVPPSDADYVSANANDVSDTYVAGDLTGSIDSIKCIQVQARARTEGAPTPTNLKLVVRSGGTDYLSGDKAVPAAEKGLSHIWETDPNTAAAWLEAGVNGAEIGIKSAA